MKKMFKILMGMLLVILVLPFFTLPALGSELNFAAEAVIPDNQINEQVSWFNLSVEPGDEQTLEVNVRNDTDEELVIEVEIAAATTNLNGVVEYRVRDIERDSTLVHDLADLVTAPETLVIPANEMVVLELELSVPREAFEGLIAGGIRLRAQESEEDIEDADAGMMIRNRFAHVIAITLQTDEALTTMPDFVVNDAWADHLNARSVVFVNIQNTEPIFANWISLNARVYRRGETVWHWNEVTAPRGMMFAPNSNMDFPIRLDGQPVETGQYTACVTITSEAFEEEMVWEDLCVDFFISVEDADALNDGDIEVTTFNSVWLIVILVVFAILVLMLIIFAVKKKSSGNVNVSDVVEPIDDAGDID